jgi:hypothetical protein
LEIPVVSKEPDITDGQIIAEFNGKKVGGTIRRVQRDDKSGISLSSFIPGVAGLLYGVCKLWHNQDKEQQQITVVPRQEGALLRSMKTPTGTSEVIVVPLRSGKLTTNLVGSTQPRSRPAGCDWLRLRYDDSNPSELRYYFAQAYNERYGGQMIWVFCNCKPRKVSVVLIRSDGSPKKILVKGRYYVKEVSEGRWVVGLAQDDLENYGVRPGDTFYISVLACKKQQKEARSPVYYWRSEHPAGQPIVACGQGNAAGGSTSQGKQPPREHVKCVNNVNVKGAEGSEIAAKHGAGHAEAGAGTGGAAKAGKGGEGGAQQARSGGEGGDAISGQASVNVGLGAGDEESTGPQSRAGTVETTGIKDGKTGAGGTGGQAKGGPGTGGAAEGKGVQVTGAETKAGDIKVHNEVKVTINKNTSPQQAASAKEKAPQSLQELIVRTALKILEDPNASDEEKAWARRRIDSVAPPLPSKEGSK